LRERIARILEDLGRIVPRMDTEPLARLGSEIGQAERIFVAGTGRSGLMARAFAMRLMHLGLSVHVVGETTTPEIGEGDLLVCCSRRGESGSHSHFIDLAHEARARAAVLTANPDSTNAQKADLTVVLPVDDDSHARRQPLGAFFEQSLLLVLEALVTQLMDDLHVDEEEMLRHHTSLE
jgi:6-phospho-3-hexuloisomerase